MFSPTVQTESSPVGGTAPCEIDNGKSEMFVFCVQSLSLPFLLCGIILILFISVGVPFLLSVSLPYTRDCSAPYHPVAGQLILVLSALAVLDLLVTLSTAVPP